MRDRACLGAFEKIAACAGGAGAGGCFDVFIPRPFEERLGVRGWGVGCAAGRDVRPAAQSLSFVSPKESNQRKSDPTGCVPPLRCGQPAVLADGVRCGTRCALTRFAQTTAASQITKRVHPSVHPLTPPAALLGASREEEGNHTGHCCARPWVFSLCGSGLARDGAYVLPMRSSRASRSHTQSPRPSAAMARRGLLKAPLAVPRSAGRGAGAAAQHAALCALTRCGCSSGVSAANKASSAAPPHARASQVAPKRSAGDTASGVAFSLVTFFWRDKRK